MSIAWRKRDLPEGKGVSPTPFSPFTSNSAQTSSVIGRIGYEEEPRRTTRTGDKSWNAEHAAGRIASAERRKMHKTPQWIASRSLDYSLSRSCWYFTRWSIAAIGSFSRLLARAPSDRCTVFFKARGLLG
jgi:hypothetical protein